MNPEGVTDIDLVPARMINAFTFCPRLAFIEWVEGQFQDNFFTVEGRFDHRRVDRPGRTLPEDAPGPAPAAVDKGPPASTTPTEGAPGEPEVERIHGRSVLLSGTAAGIIARLDLLEAEGTLATPVDYKRGSPPDVPGQAHEPEKIQLAAQALVLEENGFSCTEGVLYFAGSRQRVQVPIDEDLKQRVRAIVDELRTLARSGQLPPPLEDSPKCFGCSLSGVCMPDEVSFLNRLESEDPPRRLFPALDEALPVHVQAQYGKVGLSKDNLMIRVEDKPDTSIRLRDTSQLLVYGNVQISTQALRRLCTDGVPVGLFSQGGWFYGMVQGLPGANVLLRRLQFRAADDKDQSLRIARSLIEQKIRNQRTMLRRNAEAVPEQALEQLKGLALKAASAASEEELLGLEGSAARTYFAQFSGMLREKDETLTFRMDSRNRRPPRDPVNALLSFAYALLVKDLTIQCTAVGFDPFLGFYHKHRWGRPALALDLMEPFRPIIADSVVIGCINNGVLRGKDFTRRLGAVSLGEPGRKRFLQAFERRMDEEVTHPLFGYRVSYRRLLEVQIRLLGRYLGGEIPELPPFVTR